MGPLFSLFSMMLLGSIVFVPLFVIAVVMLGSALRAFVLAATFTIGAMAGFFAGLMLAGTLIERQTSDQWAVYHFAFAGAASVAGGVLAVFLLGKIAKYPPWRRN